MIEIEQLIYVETNKYSEKNGKEFKKKFLLELERNSTNHPDRHLQCASALLLKAR
jgi:hypothetical protein